MKKLLLLVLISQQAMAQYNVEIVRDSFGVPHIFGKTDADVVYGLAWAECEDDFNTLQWALMAAKGCLGRHLGIDGARIDYAVQLLQAQNFIKEHYEKDVSEDFKKVLIAACAGVNKYAKEHPKEILVKQVFPATPYDIIAGYMLSQALMTGVDGALSQVLDGRAKQVNFAEFGRGSNCMAMNSHKTADGNVYLDINSHQPLEGPLSWYEAHLCSEEGLNIMGSTFHGGICIFHGANEHLGWAHTTNDFDAIDILQLQPDPDKKNHYLVDGKSYKLETGKAKLSVNLAKHKEKNKFVLTVRKKIWWSQFGPTVVTKNGIFAIRVPSVMTVKSAEQWFRMNKAKNFTEWKTAVNMQGIANQHFCYADKYDTIYILSNALIPKRENGYDWKNTAPANTSANLFHGFYPIDSLPQVLNPECGYVFNANQTSFQMTCPAENPDPNKVPKNAGFGFDDNNRSRRFYENMFEYTDQMIGWKDFLKIKYDSKYPNLIRFFRKFDVNEVATMQETDYPDVAEILRKFKHWDRVCDKNDTDAVACFKTLWNAYERGGNDSAANVWLKNIPEKEKMLAQCMRDAKADLLKNFGTLSPPLGDFLRHQRGDVELPLDGGPDLWNAKYWNPYKNGRGRVWLGESYILLVKFNKKGPNEYYSVSPYGSSNKAGSPHYTDQMKLYADKKTKRMTLDKQYIYQHAERIYKVQ